jgi:hypothetical protein
MRVVGRLDSAVLVQIDQPTFCSKMAVLRTVIDFSRAAVLVATWTPRLKRDGGANERSRARQRRNGGVVQTSIQPFKRAERPLAISYID